MAEGLAAGDRAYAADQVRAGGGDNISFRPGHPHDYATGCDAADDYLEQFGGLVGVLANLLVDIGSSTACLSGDFSALAGLARPIGLVED